MLKKWINSGDVSHALICDDCPDVYHGGTGLLFDYINSVEETNRDNNPNEFAKVPMSIQIKKNALASKNQNVEEEINKESSEQSSQQYLVHLPKESQKNLKMHQNLQQQQRRIEHLGVQFPSPENQLPNKLQDYEMQPSQNSSLSLDEEIIIFGPKMTNSIHHKDQINQRPDCSFLDSISNNIFSGLAQFLMINNNSNTEAKKQFLESCTQHNFLTCVLNYLFQNNQNSTRMILLIGLNQIQQKLLLSVIMNQLQMGRSPITQLKLAFKKQIIDQIGKPNRQKFYHPNIEYLQLTTWQPLLRTCLLLQIKHDFNQNNRKSLSRKRVTEKKSTVQLIKVSKSQTRGNGSEGTNSAIMNQSHVNNTTNQFTDTGNILQILRESNNYSKRDSTKMSQNESKTQKITTDRPISEFYPSHFLELNKNSYYKEIERCLDAELTTRRPDPNALFMKQSTKKLTIVFDLDETLIKSVNDRSKLFNKEFDVHLKIQDGTEIKDMYVSIRPNAIEMLRKLKKHAELVVFTAGHKTYAESIVGSLHEIAGVELFEHVLHRDFCTPMPFIGKDINYQMKDLKILLDGRKLQNIVLIDNRAIGFANLHLTNGIPIIDYEGDPNDTELYHLSNYLMSSFIFPAQTKFFQDFHQLGASVSTHHIYFDVRNVIKKDFKLEKFMTTKAKLRQREISKQRQNARTEYLIQSNLNKQ